MSRDRRGEALASMATDMAHELRTPVSVLRGHLTMLDGVFPLDGILAVAYGRTIHLSRLVDDLRLLTRAEAGTLSLERVAARGRAGPPCRAELATGAGSNITLERLDPGLPAVRADIDRMQQVFELLTNALRHAAGGRITVRAAP